MKLIKYAVNLVGISKDSIRNRDWNRTKNNIYTNVINCWENYPTIFITTYNDESISKLIEEYKPFKYKILDKNNSDQRLTYICSLEQIKNSNVDFIISTRFDILFNQPLSEFNIDFNKFNFLFKEGNGYWENHEFVTDNLFCFPYKFIDPFIQSIQELYDNPYRNCSDLHPVYKKLKSKINVNDINFMTDDITVSHDNKYYKLDRK